MLSATILLHRLVDLALGIPRTLGIALVMLFLALGQPDLALDAAPGVVQVQRHHGVAGAFYLADQFFDLFSPQQQLAGAHGIRVHMGGGGGQGADVGAEQIDLALFDDHVGFLELHPPGADRLHLPAFEGHARLETLFDEIIVKRLLVVDNAHGVR